jgi:N-acyl homoserine lactone hydrolase
MSSKYLFRLCCLLFMLGIEYFGSCARASDVTPVRLYAIDCGRIEVKDMGMFSDTGEYDGKPGSMVDPCFLIRHPKGTLLWDAGLGDQIAENRDGVDVGGGIRFFVGESLQEQLKIVGLTANDVSYVAFSHFHLDHTGNANKFLNSIWIINKMELAAALSTSPPFGVDPARVSAYAKVKTRIIDGDYDVFGDGSVKILKAPGHTPGHQVLAIKLERSGTVILAGDLYHTRDNRNLRRVPTVNVERAETLASMDRIERIAANTHARLIVQHDPADFRSLPKFPAYLD